MPRNLLKIENLQTRFSRKIAVKDVSFDVKKGEILGIVGESGSGKSTLAQTILRLYEPDGGRVIFDGADVTKLDQKSLKAVRRQQQMIFQDPFAALDPNLTIEQIITEPLEIHDLGTKNERKTQAAEMLERVGLSFEDLPRFPHEFSGGQQQRVSIARSLILRPKFIVCDEAVSALDVSVQAQILNLLRDLQDEFGLTYLFISHNIAVTAFMSRRIGVMYLGKLVEIGQSQQITTAPRHPYTQTLIRSIFASEPSKRADKIEIVDEKDASAERPSGCVFRLRCPSAREICAAEEPLMREIDSNLTAACHFL